MSMWREEPAMEGNLYPPLLSPPFHEKKTPLSCHNRNDKEKKTSLREQEDDEKGVIVTFEYTLDTPN